MPTSLKVYCESKNFEITFARTTCKLLITAFNLSLIKCSRLFLIACLVLIGLAAEAQIEIKINYTPGLSINSLLVNTKTSTKDLVKAIGEPSTKQISAGGETNYFYDSLGLVFFTDGNHLIGLGINYNWDGDARFPKKTFPGTLNLGELQINPATTNHDIAGIKTVDFICPISVMCASKDRHVPIRCTVGFKDESISQVVFLIR